MRARIATHGHLYIFDESADYVGLIRTRSLATGKRVRLQGWLVREVIDVEADAETAYGKNEGPAQAPEAAAGEAPEGRSPEAYVEDGAHRQRVFEALAVTTR